MIDILEESSAAASGHKIDKEEPASTNDHGVDRDDIAADGAANTTGGGGISDVLNSQYKKSIECDEKSEKRQEEDLFEKLWGWERLLPLCGSVKWSDYSSYLEEYYKRNAHGFIADVAAANQTREDLQIAAAADIWGGISDVFSSQYTKNIKRGEKGEERKEEDLFEKLWGWERLLPLCGLVKWSDYSNYLEEYYKRNASEFVADAADDQNLEDLQIAATADMFAAVAKSCLKMEEELLSEWKTRVERTLDGTLPISTIIQSSLIKQFALSICGAGGELRLAF
ncbi:uncharacterized protein [Triticum aestivum]|uniref:uncharacterized protein n=1 Tax=Triticum aestivum TaxID=4565 RepID=UPI001D00A071|nr:uncharacterized protein LOC123141172 [Triticum aestivum]